MSKCFLLDTHCWLWWNAEPERLNDQSRRIISDIANDIFLSAASAWEIAIKHALGRLVLPEPPVKYIPTRIAANQIKGLAIQFHHALKVNELPHHHRDPFDRLLIAQAKVEGMTLITADSLLQQYDVDALMAVQG